jgi:hypothetical protein
MKLEGGELLVLKTLLDLQGDSKAYVEDTEVAAVTKMAVQDVRNWLETLEGKGLVERTRLTDGFSAYGTAKGKLALRMMEPIPSPTSPLPTSDPQRSSEPQGGGAIDSSGTWVMLGDRFFESKQVKQRGGVVTLVIHSRTADDDAAIQGLGSARRGDGSIAYAYRNDAFTMTVVDTESESAGEGLDWTISLKPKDIEYGGRATEMATTVEGRHYSANEIAELRARRILLNDPPPMKRDHRRISGHTMLDSLICGTGVQLPAERCIVRDLYSQFGSDPALYLRLTRLAAIYDLKAGDVVERVERLTLGPISEGRVHVNFLGKRRKIYSNADPHPIEIEGDCPLT